MSPGRSLIKTGMLTKKSNSKDEENEYQFFLFNDLLAYARPSLVGGVRLQRKLELTEMSIRPLGHKPDHSGQSRWWFEVKTPFKPFVLSCPDETESKDWYDDINMCLEDFTLRRSKLNP